MTVSEKYKAWLACPAMNEELLSDLRSMDEDARNDSFYRDLAFGTGGLRGVLGAGCNRMNLFTVAKATRGLARYLKETFPSPSCAVSFGSSCIPVCSRRRCFPLPCDICKPPPAS